MSWQKYEFMGPSKFLLSKSEVCTMLGNISEATLDRMVANGRFPKGIKPSAGTGQQWAANDIAAWLHLASRLEEPDKEKSEKS